MKKAFLFSVLVSFFIVSCGLIEQLPKEDPIKGAGAITLKFIQMNDVYEIAPLNGGESGGLARVAHIRDSIQKEFPNTYLFLAGDFLNPSLLGTLKVDGEQLNGKQMVDVLNAMDIDLVTFGTHEFDLSEADLQKRLNESTFNWTSANVRHVTENGVVKPFATKWEYTNVPVSDYTTFTATDPDGNEIKFGVFGLTIPSKSKEYVSYGDPYENAVRAYYLALQKSDFVVGLTHLPIDEDKKIAERLRDVPLIMGGHEHYNMLEKEGRTIIAKADANAKSVYVHTIIYNLRTRMLYLDSELVLVNDKIASEPKVDRVVNKWTSLIDDKLKEVVEDPNQIIYNSKIQLDGTDKANRSIQTNLGDIITKAMAYVYDNKVDASIVNGGSIRVDDMLKSPITGKDIFRVLPFGGSVVKVEVKGSLLKEILNFGKEKQGTGAYLQTNNISEDSKGDWLIGKKPIENNKKYTIAMSDYLLKGLDIPFLTKDNPDILKVYEPKENETAADIRKAIIVYLKSLTK